MKFFIGLLIPLICIPLLVILLFCLITSVASFILWDVSVFSRYWHAFLLTLDWPFIRFYLLFSFIAGLFLYFSENE